MEIPMTNFIAALHAAFNILIACITTGLIYCINYALTKYIEQYDKFTKDE